LIEITAINNPGDPSIYSHLIKHDSVHSTFSGNVHYAENRLYINESSVHFFTEKDPSKIPWSEAGCEIVIDATGKFKSKEDLSKHIRETVKKVVLCAPGSKDIDQTIVMGINHTDYDPKNHDVVSNASCTTNCLAPVAKVINDAFGIENGFMTTVHAYTSDQRLLDHSHSDLRRARAAAMSMIPTTTGAAKAIGLVIPELAGKLDGYAVRVPTPNVSMVDLTVNLKNETSIQEVNQKLKEAANSNLSGILSVSDEELVSNDYNGSTYSSIVDAPLTNMISPKSLKLVVWYDNESGFSNRVINLTELIASKL
jgi:glyceraldehyde-3-phosphate dehydrogenase type I